MEATRWTPIDEESPDPGFGTVIRAFNTDGIAVLETIYPAGSVLRPHQHTDSYLALTLTGGYRETKSSKHVEHAPRSASFHPPNEEHSVEIGTRDVHCLVVEIPARHIERLRDVTKNEAQNLVDQRGPLVWLASRLHGEVSGSLPASALVIEGLILEILGTVSRLRCQSSDRYEPRWLGTLDDLLRSEFDQRVTVTNLAERLGMHPVHLSRTWRRFRGLSIGESIQRARIEAACELIAAGAESLAEVALDVGFADQTHFTRVFKQFTGITPGAYRAQFRRTTRS